MEWDTNPSVMHKSANNYLLKVSNKNTRKR